MRAEGRKTGTPRLGSAWDSGRSGVVAKCGMTGKNGAAYWRLPSICRPAGRGPGHGPGGWGEGRSGPFEAGKMRREMRKETHEKNLQLHVGLDTMIG